MRNIRSHEISPTGARKTVGGISHRFRWLIPLVGTLLSVCTGFSQDLTPDSPDIPDPVKTIIQSEIEGGKIDHITKKTGQDEVLFTVDFTRAGASHSFSVTTDGILHEPVGINDIPELLRQNIQKLIADGKIVTIDKTTDNGQIFFDVSFTRDGRPHTVSAADDGTLSEQIDLAEAPQAVQQTIREETAKGEIDVISRTNDDGQIYYDVDFTKEGEQLSFTVMPDGSLYDSVDKESPGPTYETRLKKFLMPAGLLAAGIAMIFWYRRKNTAPGN